MMFASAALAALFCAAPVQAGPFSDELSKCLVKSATPADLEIIIRWAFAAMASHPAVKPIVSMTPEQHTEYTRSAAELFQRLMLKDCRPETVAAVKFEGAAALETGFKVFGEVSFRGLTTDPAVAKEFESLGSYADDAAWSQFMKDAGLPEAPAKVQ